MSIQHPHKIQVKFCPHHQRVGTTDQIADFLYTTVVPLYDVGIEVAKASLGCGCTVWMSPIKIPPRPAPTEQPSVADSTKGKARKATPEELFQRLLRRLPGL